LSYLFAIIYNVPFGNDATGIVLLYGLVFGAPFVAIVGANTNRKVKNRPNAEHLSMMGYLIPAVAICGLFLIGNLIPLLLHFIGQP
jgi:hypothetical protein